MFPKSHRVRLTCVSDALSISFLLCTQFDCVGITDVIYVSKQDLYELGVARLELESGQAIDAIDASSWQLNYAQAHALAPPRCYLAPMATETDKIRLDDLGMGLGWTGVYKNFKDAFDNRQANLDTRRDGWSNLDGTTVPDMFWDEGEPEIVSSDNTQDTEHAAAYTSGGLASLSPTLSLPGAYYKCCSLYAFEDEEDEAGVDDLEDILLSIISIE